MVGRRCCLAAFVSWRMVGAVGEEEIAYEGSLKRWVRPIAKDCMFL